MLKPSFYAPLLSSLDLIYGQGVATYTRATSATVWGYAEADNSSTSQSLLTIPPGVPRFEGARFLSSINKWSSYFADGVAIPYATLKGYLSEGRRTNLLLQSAVPATQNITVTNQAYTVSMWGAGTCTLSGTGSGVLTGTGENNRVQLTFTPTAGTLTLSFSGTNTNGQLEAGAFASSYIPTTTASVTRNADDLSYPAAQNVNGIVGSTNVEFLKNNTVNYLGILSTYTSGGGGGMPMVLGSIRDLSINDGSYRSSGLIPTINNFVKVATRWSGSSDGFLNGVKGTTAVFDGDMNIGLNLNIGRIDANATYLFGNIRNVKIWKKALTDAQLINLTR
jgi:hypothetical protein